MQAFQLDVHCSTANSEEENPYFLESASKPWVPGEGEHRGDNGIGESNMCLEPGVELAEVDHGQPVERFALDKGSVFASIMLGIVLSSVSDIGTRAPKC